MHLIIFLDKTISVVVVVALVVGCCNKIPKITHKNTNDAKLIIKCKKFFKLIVRD